MHSLIRNIMTSRSFGIFLFCLAVCLAGVTGFSLLRGAEASSSSGEEKGFPLTVRELLAEGQEAEEKGRFSEAALAYEKTTLLQPDVPEGYFRLAALYFRMNLFAKAEETYLRAIALKLDVPEAYFRLGYVAEQQGDFPKAAAYYQKAEENFYTGAALFFNLGNVLFQMDKKDEAIDYYIKAVAKKPDHLDAFVNLSVVSFHKGAYQDAEFYLRKAMALGYQAPREYLETLEGKMK